MQVRISLQPELRIHTGGSEAAVAQLLPLLHAIRLWGSLGKAAEAVGCSYSHAWRSIGEWRDLLGYPLAKAERGRGTRLTLLGERLLRADRLVRERLSPALAALVAELEYDLTDARREMLEGEISLAR